MEEHDANYVGGDINGGIAGPSPAGLPAGRSRATRTARRGLYLCSSATPPGGGVHGMGGVRPPTPPSGTSSARASGSPCGRRWLEPTAQPQPEHQAADGGHGGPRHEHQRQHGDQRRGRRRASPPMTPLLQLRPRHRPAGAEAGQRGGVGLQLVAVVAEAVARPRPAACRAPPGRSRSSRTAGDAAERRAPRMLIAPSVDWIERSVVRTRLTVPAAWRTVSGV